MKPNPFQLLRPFGLAIVSCGLLLSGCDVPTTPVEGVTGPMVKDIKVSHQRLAGAEAFTVHFRMAVPSGKFVKAYGLKTPYEKVVRKLNRPLTMAIPDGWVSLEQVYFGRAPVTGDYPFEIWLINEDGQASNPLTGHVQVQ